MSVSRQFFEILFHFDLFFLIHILIHIVLKQVGCCSDTVRQPQHLIQTLGSVDGQIFARVLFHAYLWRSIQKVFLGEMLTPSQCGKDALC